MVYLTKTQGISQLDREGVGYWLNQLCPAPKARTVNGVERVPMHDAVRWLHCGEAGWGTVLYCECCEDRRQPGWGGQYDKTVPFRCMSRVCPECAEYMASDLQRRYTPIIEALAARGLPPEWAGPYTLRGASSPFRHVILGTRFHVSEISTDLVRRVMAAVAATMRELGWASDGAGAVASLEIGETGGYLHVHVLVYGPFRWGRAAAKELHEAQYGGVPGRVAGKFVQRVWARHLTGDENDNLYVKVKAVKDKAQALYTIKYAVKGFAGLSPELIAALHVALRGTRRVRAWGCFYGALRDALVEEWGTAQEIAGNRCPRCQDRGCLCGSKLRVLSEFDFDRLVKSRRVYLYSLRTNKYGGNSDPPVYEPGEILI